MSAATLGPAAEGAAAGPEEGSATTALVLGGGGARAAYQVGVLRALQRLRQQCLGEVAAQRNPFGVIVGTSAGAINAAALVARADRFDQAVEHLAGVWHDFAADQVYRSDSLGVMRSGARWLSMLSLGWIVARWRRSRPRSLLDNAPLAQLLQQLVPLERVPQLLQQGHLQAWAVTASGYGSGEHVTFYDAARPIEPWQRSQRLAVPQRITHAHLMASSAIPFVFPAASLSPGGQTGWFGDGSMRQTAPLAPAIHLGAERLVVIGAGRLHEPTGRHVDSTAYPSLAQIAGHALSSIFLDALAVDIERLQRINRTLALLPPALRTGSALRPIEALVISPSQRIDEIAARHVHALPLPVRSLLRGVGVGASGGGPAQGAALASYLLFESPFTRGLMALGEADLLARRADVLAFFGWPEPPSR